MKIRRFKSKDFSVVLEIENQSFPNPWTKQDFYRGFKNENCVCYVIEDEKEVVGYIVYVCDSTSCKIINLAVAKHYRRHGVAQSLLSEVIEQMEQTPILASISDRNLGAQLFFRSLGFKAEKISRNFFGPDHNSYDFVLLRMSNIKQKDELCRGV